MKDGDTIKLDEYADIETHWIALYSSNNFKEFKYSNLDLRL